MAKLSSQTKLRFSLRTLLAIATLIALWLGNFVRVAERQRSAVIAIEKMGGSIFYDYQCDNNGNPRGPFLANTTGDIVSFLRKRLGTHYVDSVAYVGLNGRRVYDVDLQQLAPFRRLLQLNLAHTKITDNGLATLERFTRLRRVDVSGTGVTESGLANLKSTLPGVTIQEDLEFERLTRLIGATVTFSNGWETSESAQRKEE